MPSLVRKFKILDRAKIFGGGGFPVGRGNANSNPNEIRVSHRGRPWFPAMGQQLHAELDIPCQSGNNLARARTPGQLSRRDYGDADGSGYRCGRLTRPRRRRKGLAIPEQGAAQCRY
jgi:hypothetical protein